MSKPRPSDAQQASREIDQSVGIVHAVIRPRLKEIKDPWPVVVFEWFDENWVFLFFLIAAIVAGMVMR